MIECHNVTVNPNSDESKFMIWVQSIKEVIALDRGYTIVVL